MIKFLDLKAINDQYQNEITEAIQGVINSGWYIKGNAVSTFENNFADYCGTKYCIGVANGLDALILIFRALIVQGKLKKGDEVIVPANTYIASVLAITENDLTPILIEPNESSYNLGLKEIKSKITSKTKAVLTVHLYGQLAEDVSEFCINNNLLLVEDAAQAHGAQNSIGQFAGSFGIASGFSFYPGKNLGALGDGGAVVTNDLELGEIIKVLSNYGSSERYVHKLKGVNSRLDDVQAAVLDVKLKYLDRENEQRRAIAEFYIEHIKNHKIILPKHPEDRRSHVWHLFVIQASERQNLMNYLFNKGIETLIHYPIPIHKQQAYSELKAMELPVTERLQKQILSIPISPVLNQVEVEHIVEAINEY